MERINLKTKKIFIYILIIIFLSLVSFSLYKTYAYYKIVRSYDVIKTKIGDFRGSKINKNYYIDEVLVAEKPNKDDVYFENVVCDNSKYSWNYKKFDVDLSDITKYEVNCDIKFKKIVDLYGKVRSQSQGLDSDNNIDYKKIAITDNGQGVFETTNTQDNKSVYFYRGKVDNNNVLFGGFCWKIVRTSENDGVKMIYNGVSDNGKCTDKKGRESLIATSSFNENYDDNTYVGYMYGKKDADNYNDAHSNLYDSNVKKAVDNWYEKYLINYSDFLEDAFWCDDRTVVAGGDNNILDENTGTLGYGKNFTGYGVSKRSSAWTIDINPTLKCVNKNDRYTVSSDYGNKSLKYPIALINADELIYAGSTGAYEKLQQEAVNKDFYLYSNFNYWTMSAAIFYTNSKAYVSRFLDGYLHNNYTAETTNGVRPMISLKKGINYISGNGSNDTPYVINNVDINSNLNNYIKVGDYVSAFSTNTSYTISANDTGYSKDQKVNPSELKLWRVIKINEDGTFDAISEYLSTASIHFYGMKGFQNSVGVFNNIAKQYNNPYTISSRIIGYKGQTEFITDTSVLTSETAIWKQGTSSSTTSDMESKGGGDLNYSEDIDLINKVYGNLLAYKLNSFTKTSNYWISSRSYGYSNSTTRYFMIRGVSSDGILGQNNVYYHNSSGFGENDRWMPIRPILTFKANLKAIGDGTKEFPWFLYN